MKKVFLSFFCSLFVLAAMVMSAQGAEKISICHIPPDNPTNLQTISVGLTSLPTHLAHCDTIGACTGDACTSDGGLCGCNSACCSGNCSGGMCAPACKSNGESCNPPSTSSSECCSSICSGDGMCAACMSDGGPCSSTEDCCSDDCSVDGICVPACTGDGSPCSSPSTSSSECCGGICSGEGVCASACTIGPEHHGTYCSSDLPCCPEIALSPPLGGTGGGVCLFEACYTKDSGVESCSFLGDPCDSLNGPFCCFEYSCSGDIDPNDPNPVCIPSTVCTLNGHVCSSNSDCCSGVCSGEGICASACTFGLEELDDPCTFDLPCCAGACFHGTCQADLTCVLPGVTCSESDICCFSHSCSEDGVCTACTDGREANEPDCAFNLPCCDGACIDGSCWAGLTCVSPGDPCVQSDQCCFTDYSCGESSGVCEFTP